VSVDETEKVRQSLDFVAVAEGVSAEDNDVDRDDFRHVYEMVSLTHVDCVDEAVALALVVAVGVGDAR